MMEERMKEALKRTREHLVRHLEDLNDEIDQADGRIGDHMVVDGLKDCVKTLRCIGEIMGKGGNGGDHDASEDAEEARGASILR